jgi:hypothetical protein
LSKGALVALPEELQHEPLPATAVNDAAGEAPANAAGADDESA